MGWHNNRLIDRNSPFGGVGWPSRARVIKRGSQLPGSPDTLGTGDKCRLLSGNYDRFAPHSGRSSGGREIPEAAARSGGDDGHGWWITTESLSSANPG
jgi:hypothetical protein